MNISILCTSYPRSKKDHWVPFMHSFARELAKTEDVKVVTSGHKTAKNYEIRDKVKIYRFSYFYPKRLQKLTYTGGMRESFAKKFLPKIQAPFFMFFFFLKSLKVTRNCDIINAHWILSGLVALPIKLIYKKPIVLTEHGGSIRGLPGWLNKFVLKRMDMITSAHHDMIKSIKEMGIINIVDVKNFLDEEKFLRKHNKSLIKKELKIKEKYVVTFVGRFEELKDPLTFVRAIPYVTKKNKNIKFIMIGDGHLRQNIQEEVKKLSVQKHIILIGPSSQIDKYLAISDTFIACSAIENCFSTTILEAMLSKVPCIITKAGLTEKFFKHKHNAYLVTKKNAEMLATGILNVLKSKKLRNKLARHGLKFLESNGFRNKVIRIKIMNIFRQVIKT